MGFTISYDVGLLGYAGIALMAGAAAIVAIAQFQATRDARRDVNERDHVADVDTGAGG